MMENPIKMDDLGVPLFLDVHGTFTNNTWMSIVLSNWVISPLYN